jgi:uncharacterized protein (TIGR02996 family)
VSQQRAREALEAALMADLDDLAVHAAYADLLMEQGDPRGEFIQGQLALENEGLPWKEKKRLEQRQTELLNVHGQEWRSPVVDLLSELGEEIDAGDIGFRRGWIDELHLTGRMSLDLACRLSELPALRLLRTLDGGWDRKDAARGTPPAGTCLSNVRVFKFGGEPRFGSAAEGRSPAVAFLVGAMSRLEELRLFARWPDVETLFALPNLTRLRLLYYSRGEHYPLEVLAANPALRRLRGLSCVPRPLVGRETAYIGVAELEAIVSSGHLERLSHLRLRKTDFGDTGCEAIVRSGILKRLRVLDLSWGAITDRGARLLVGCSDAVNLRSLDLRANALTPAGAAAVQAALPGARVSIHSQHGREDDQYLLDGDWE